GPVQLCACRFGAAEFPVWKTRVLFVRRTQQLDVKAVPDRAEYRPGGRARAQFTLTDHQGKPAPGALSLAAGDEAVFSVLDPATGMGPAFFTSQSELLKPIYEVYPWSPQPAVQGTAEDRARFEQALFARTARETGPTERDRILRQLLPYL